MLAPAPALLLLGLSSRGAETAEEPKGKCWILEQNSAQALTLRTDSLDNYLCKTKKARDKQGQSRDSDICKVRTEPGEMELLGRGLT